MPAWGGDGPTSSPGLGIGSTAKKALLDLLGGVRGWPPQAAGDDPHGAGDQGQPNVQAFGSARAHHPDINKGKVQESLMVLVLAAMEPVAGLAGDMTAVLAAMEPVDFRVVWEVDLLAIPEVVVSRWSFSWRKEVRVVPVEGLLIIPEMAVCHFPGEGAPWWWAWRSTWRSPTWSWRRASWRSSWRRRSTSWMAERGDGRSGGGENGRAAGVAGPRNSLCWREIG